MFIAYFKKDVQIWEVISLRMLSGLLVWIINHTRHWSLLNKKEVENKQMVSLRYVNFWNSLGKQVLLPLLLNYF